MWKSSMYNVPFLHTVCINWCFVKMDILSVTAENILYYWCRIFLLSNGFFNAWLANGFWFLLKTLKWRNNYLVCLPPWYGINTHIPICSCAMSLIILNHECKQMPWWCVRPHALLFLIVWIVSELDWPQINVFMIILIEGRFTIKLKWRIWFKALIRLTWANGG